MFWKKKPPPKVFDYIVINLQHDVYVRQKVAILNSMGAFGYELINLSKGDEKTPHELVFKRETDGTVRVPMQYVEQLQKSGIGVDWGIGMPDDH